MKKRILTFGAVLVLLTVLVMPGVVLAANTTEVTGAVTEGYSFTAPSAINLGSMAPSGIAYTDYSDDGRLDGNNAAGYTVTGNDTKLTNTGYMVSGSDVLTNKLQISNYNGGWDNADTGHLFVSSSGPTGADISLYVSQLVSYTDPVATGYTITITITFTVTPK